MRLWPERRDAKPSGAESGDLAARLRATGLVDGDWYARTYPEADLAGGDAASDYAGPGAAAGRDPNPLFDTAWYLDRYPDVRDAGVNPLLHYAGNGAAEGRDPGPGFDTAYYLAENPGVEAAGLNALRHYLEFGRAEGRQARPSDEGEAFEAAIRLKRSGAAGAAAALLRGERAARVHFALPRADPPAPDGGLPLPSADLARRIGSMSLADFDASGRAIRDTIVRALPEGFAWRGARCLDFGCGVGRALRHFAGEAAEAEIWGCDIDGPSIRWAIRNLSPPFRFFQISETPSIPFEADSFDLVYAISVLSHIHTDWQQWMMEIRRILKPGGVFVLTFMAQTPFEEMLSRPYWEQGPDFGMWVENPHNNWNAGGPMIFLSPAWVTTFWAPLFDIELIAMDGFIDYQSFCVLRKPARGAPLRRISPAPFYPNTAQGFHPDAVGRIKPQVDAARPYGASYGIDVGSARSTAVEGWAVFRRDRPESLDCRIDGAPVAVEARFEDAGPHRDWADTARFTFAFDLPLAGVATGAHELAVDVRSHGGASHAMTIPLLRGGEPPSEG